MVKSRTRSGFVPLAPWFDGARREPGRPELSTGIVGAQTEGARFWLQVVTELQNREVKDIFHRLRGWAERISGSDRSGVSPNRGAVMHCASGAGPR